MKWGSRWLLAATLLSGVVTLGGTEQQEEPLEAARRAYEKSDYAKAVEILKQVAARDPQSGEIHLMLAKSYFEMQDLDNAVASAQKAVAINPNSSLYHEWLGKVYGEKASHAGIFSALSLAKKSRKEFETAVQLDERNFSARQALIEFDCSAPGIAGGGEDKARPEIEKLAALDVAEGHYAAGNCRRQKKDFVSADREFKLSLETGPKSRELIYDIGDYALTHEEPELLLEAVEVGERVAPSDPRGMFYRAAAFVLRNERPQEAERMMREYLKLAPIRTAYPRPAIVHLWLGRLHERQGEKELAILEYQTAAALEPKNRNVREALKRIEKN